VDEALFLSDRVVMMTSGPEAHVGEILSVPFERPRRRAELLETQQYYDLRGQLIAFLESEGHQKPSAAPPPKSAAAKGGLWSLLRSAVPR
jgi:ABC-type nitrate/sulfonate/bicarbonate transport system ATPase subunit